MPTSDQEYYESLPRRRVGSGVLLLDGAGHVLLVEPTYKQQWEIPGGSTDAGEDPRQTCQRECLEELGLNLRVGRLLVLEHQSHALPMGDSTMFIYDAGVLPSGNDIRLPADELRSYRFVHEDALLQFTTERLARRVRFALLALREGSTVELSNGVRCL